MADALKAAIRARNLAAFSAGLKTVPGPVHAKMVGEAARMGGWLA